MREKLNALFVERIANPGLYGDGGGLYLRVSGKRGRSWVLRYMKDGVSRELGLGSYSMVTLAMARQKAREYQLAIRDGRDPRIAKCNDITGKQIETLLSAEELLDLPRDRVGVYFLFFGRKLQYIGQSANMAKRVAAHKRNGLPFDDWVSICVPLEDLDAVEAMYIRQHKPPFNKGRRNNPSQTVPQNKRTPGTTVHDGAQWSEPHQKLPTTSSG